MSLFFKVLCLEDIVTSLSFHQEAEPKAFYISRAVKHFYETQFEIWGGFWPAGQIKPSPSSH